MDDNEIRHRVETIFQRWARGDESLEDVAKDIRVDDDDSKSFEREIRRHESDFESECEWNVGRLEALQTHFDLSLVDDNDNPEVMALNEADLIRRGTELYGEEYMTARRNTKPVSVFGFADEDELFSGGGLDVHEIPDCVISNIPIVYYADDLKPGMDKNVIFWTFDFEAVRREIDGRIREINRKSIQFSEWTDELVQRMDIFIDPDDEDEAA